MGDIGEVSFGWLVVSAWWSVIVSTTDDTDYKDFKLFEPQIGADYWITQILTLENCG